MEELTDIKARIDGLKSTIRLINAQISNLEKDTTKSLEEKEKEKENLYEDLNKKIEESNYNKILYNLRSIKEFDYTSMSNKEEIDKKLDDFRKEIIEANKNFPPEALKRILEKLDINEEEFKDIIKLSTEKEEKEKAEYYRKEYEQLNKELDNLLGGKYLNEIGLNDLNSVFEKHSQLSSKSLELSNSLNEILNNHPELFDEKTKNELLLSRYGFKLRLDRELTSIKSIKAIKELKKKEFETKIEEINKDLDKVYDLRNKAWNELQEIRKNPELNVDAESKKVEYIDKLNDYISKKEEYRELLNNNIDIILNGGVLKDIKLDIELPLEEKVEMMKKEEEAPSMDSPKPASPGSGTPAPSGPSASSGPASSGTPAAASVTPPEPELPNTLENLATKGIVPNIKFIGKENLLAICKALNIPHGNLTTELTEEQVDRLKNDHQIQTALLNQKIFERNRSKIKEYDKLITKYETIKKTIEEAKINVKSEDKEVNIFDEQYVKKVEQLITKLKAERKTLFDKNKKIGAFENSEVLKGVHELREGDYEDRALNQNDKLREQYVKLDTLRSKTAHSKFKKAIQEKRVEKVLARIEQLKEKKGKIASKQTEIINKNAETYIEKITAKFNRALAKQERLEHSVDRVIDLSDRIMKSKEEKELVQQDRMAETKLFDRIALDIENGRLGREIKGMESEIDREKGRIR